MDGRYLAEQVISSVDMPTILRYYGFDVSRDGFSRCPFHSEKTASFKAYPGNRGFYCYGCGAGGSVIDFVKKYFGLNFIDAVKKINDDFCLNLPINKGKPSLRQQRAMEHRQAEISQEQAEEGKLLKEYYDALDQFVECDKALAEFKPALSEEPLNPKFVHALQKIEYTRYKLDEAEGRLINYEHRR